MLHISSETFNQTNKGEVMEITPEDFEAAVQKFYDTEKAINLEYTEYEMLEYIKKELFHKLDNPK